MDYHQLTLLVAEGHRITANVARVEKLIYLQSWRGAL